MAGFACREEKIQKDRNMSVHSGSPMRIDLINNFINNKFDFIFAFIIFINTFGYLVTKVFV